MYSAFGVDHYGQDIIAKRDSKLLLRARPLVQSGVRQVGEAARGVLKNPAHANKTIGELKTPLLNEFSHNSPAGGAIESVRGIRRKVNAAKAGGSTESTARLALANTTVGDIHNAANVKRVTNAPENLFRGKKTTTTKTNLLTGENSQRVQREGNRFFKSKDVTTTNGEKSAVKGKEGGLTGAGKAVFVGGPAAAAGAGAVAYDKKKNFPNGY